MLKPSSAVSEGGASLSIEADGSILATGKNPSPDVYSVTAGTKLTGITGIRLEVLDDPRLPAHGPGRAYNGNFALNEFGMTVLPSGARDKALPVRLQNASASFSQASFGGWPVAAAIDGDPKTAWSIDPREGMSQTAVFETEEPIDLTEGGALQFTLDQGYRSGPGDHTLGRFRFSAITSKPPLPHPIAKNTERFTIEAQVPASQRGGIFVVAAKLKRESEAVSLGNIGTYFTADAKLAGRPIPCRPVIGKLTYPSCWQAWRIVVASSPQPRTVELSIAASVPGGVNCVFQGHFVPNK